MCKSQLKKQIDPYFWFCGPGSHFRMTGCMHTTGELVAEHVGVPSGRAVPALVFELRLALGDAQARALFNAR